MKKWIALLLVLAMTLSFTACRQPEDTYTVEDVLADPNLAACRAVVNGNVYRLPNRAEAWDSPVPGSILGALWLANILHPDQISDAQCTARRNGFYETFYHFTYGDFCWLGVAVLLALCCASLFVGKYPLSPEKLLAGDPLQLRVFLARSVAATELPVSIFTSLLLSQGRVLGMLHPRTDTLETMEQMLSRVYGPVSLQYVTAKNGSRQLTMINEDTL